MGKSRESERMLPGDFQKWLKEKNKVENTKKELRKPKGFFTLPEELEGDTELPTRPFLVFYFDDDDEYERVRKFFEKLHSKTKSHPDLDEQKLVELVDKEMNKNEKCQKKENNKKQRKDKSRRKK